MAKRRKKSPGGLPAKGRLRDMADALWSLAVRADWNYLCAVCGASKCEAHHLVPRQHEETRYDIRNGIALCAVCHQFDPDISPHQNAMGWVDWLGSNFPAAYQWYQATMESGAYREFDEVKNVAYYLDVLRSLREYVEPEEFERVVGVKLARHLEEDV